MPTSKKPHTEESMDESSQLDQILTMLKSIDQRLTKLEQNPLNDGARFVSQGAKAFADTAKEVYEKVEARKWFDKSYEAASGACDTLGQHFKTWWESRGGSTTEAPKKSDEDVVEGEVISKKEKDHHP